MTGIERVTSRRVWFVPDVIVWGQPDLGEAIYLAHESAGNNASVFYGRAAISHAEQTIKFSQLTDHRGNSLPQTLKSPRVLPRSKDQHNVFIVGTEAESDFKIARDPDARGSVTTDLLIMELGD